MPIKAPCMERGASEYANSRPAEREEGLPKGLGDEQRTGSGPSLLGHSPHPTCRAGEFVTSHLFLKISIYLLGYLIAVWGNRHCVMHDLLLRHSDLQLWLSSWGTQA